MKLIVGLGNPEKKYLETFHNMGFLVLDEIATELNITFNKTKFNALYYKGKYQGSDIIIAKPLTYMNNSGQAISALMNYYNIELQDLLVIYDDLDLPCGKIRLRVKGHDGGHNGLKSINTHLGSIEYKRIRIGIDRHQYISIVDYVLSKPTQEQTADLQPALKNAAQAAIAFISEDFNKVMNKYNVSQ
ncbi:MAG: aminoacyl-tRNA hydrolase [Erysipelotrichaceae bacterium]